MPFSIIRPYDLLMIMVSIAVFLVGCFPVPETLPEVVEKLSISCWPVEVSVGETDSIEQSDPNGENTTTKEEDNNLGETDTPNPPPHDPDTEDYTVVGETEHWKSRKAISDFTQESGRLYMDIYIDSQGVYRGKYAVYIPNPMNSYGGWAVCSDMKKECWGKFDFTSGTGIFIAVDDPKTNVIVKFNEEKTKMFVFFVDRPLINDKPIRAKLLKK